MDVKKKAKADVYRFRGLFLNLGLVVALVAALTAFNWKSYEEVAGFGILNTGEDPPVVIPNTDIKPPPPPKKKIILPIVTEAEEDEEIDMEDYEFIFDIDDDLDYENLIECKGDEEPDPDIWIGIVEQQPEPVGGYEAFNKFLRKNMKYPNRARKFGVQGKVFVQFVVGLNGELTDIKVIKGIGSGCDEEAMRVIKAHPNWKPGMQRGREVKVQMVVPIFFQLQ